jgi:nondiscriminating glutamyl-tRNA synthetase
MIKLSNTPRQLLLLTALGLPAPRYGHIALVLGEDGTPLGKRQGSRSVHALRDQGYFPLALDNTLARLGHAYEGPGYWDLDGLAAGFSLDHLIVLMPRERVRERFAALIKKP